VADPSDPGRAPAATSGGVPVYRVWNPDGGFVDLDAGRHLPRPRLRRRRRRLSVIEYAAESIGWAQATEIFGATFFGEGMNPSGIVETPKPDEPAPWRRLREELKKLYKGPKGERTASSTPA
jgi:hypothetical protein